jgi:tryptophanyl-tRNA synthetase
MRPIRERFEALRSDPGELDAILTRGAERASTAAAPTLAAAYEAVGLRRSA